MGDFSELSFDGLLELVSERFDKERNQALAEYKDLKKEVAHLYIDLQNKGAHVNKLLDHIKELEARPTLTDIGGLQESINARESEIAQLRREKQHRDAEINILRNRAIELDRYSHERELKLVKETKEAKGKLKFWRDWGVVIGMMIANVIWFVSKVIF